MSVKAVGAEDFDAQVIKNEKPVLVDFWAPWCGPCKMLAPILDQLSEDYKDRLEIVKVNVDEADEIAKKYGVRGVPTLILMRNGAVEATRVGVSSRSQLKTFLGDI